MLNLPEIYTTSSNPDIITLVEYPHRIKIVDSQGNPVKGRYIALHASIGDHFGFKGYTNEEGIFEANLVPGIKFKIRLYAQSWKHGDMLNLPEIYTARESFKLTLTENAIYVIKIYGNDGNSSEDILLVTKDDLEFMRLSDLNSPQVSLIPGIKFRIKWNNLVSPEMFSVKGKHSIILC
jgi:hypothetical protein